MKREFLFASTTYDEEQKCVCCGGCRRPMKDSEQAVRFGGVWLCESCVVQAVCAVHIGCEVKATRNAAGLTVDVSDGLTSYKLASCPVELLREACER